MRQSCVSLGTDLAVVGEFLKDLVGRLHARFVLLWEGREGPGYSCVRWGQGQRGDGMAEPGAMHGHEERGEEGRGAEKPSFHSIQ